jgi:hypothetical protein
VKETVTKYFEAKSKETETKPSMELTAFMPEKIAKMKLEDLLHVFMDDNRINRAKTIKNDEVVIEKASEEDLKARVREYHISIDVPSKLILHDCPDWSRSAPARQLCKHMGKVMMIAPESVAVSILRKIAAERDEWQFKQYVA